MILKKSILICVQDFHGMNRLLPEILNMIKYWIRRWEQTWVMTLPKGHSKAKVYDNKQHRQHLTGLAPKQVSQVPSIENTIYKIYWSYISHFLLNPLIFSGQSQILGG